MAKIVHVVEAWTGGISTYVNNMVEIDLSQRNEVIIYYSGTIPFKDNPLVKVRHYISSRKPTRLRRTVAQIRKLLNQDLPDHVFTHSTFPGFYVRADIRNRKFNITHIPHCWPFLMKGVDRLRLYAYIRLEIFLAKQSRRILVMSREELNAALELGFPEEKLVLVRTAIPDMISLENIHSGSIDNCNCSVINIGFFGRFDLQKGYDLLLPVMRNFQDTEIKFVFHLIGDYVNSKATRRPKNSTNCIYYGWLSRQASLELMARMDYTIIPSRWEGMAIVPIESLCLGVPPIVSPTTSITEVILDGYNGIVIDGLTETHITQAIMRAAKADRAELGKNARKTFEDNFEYNIFKQEIKKLHKY